MMPFYFGYTAEEKIRVDQMDTGSEFRIIMMVSLCCFVLSGIIYTIISYRKIGKYQKMVTLNFAYAEKISMKWLKFLIHGMAIIILVMGVAYFLKEGIGMHFDFNIDLIFFGLIIAFIFFLGYFGIRFQGIFSEKTTHSVFVEPQQNGEYRRSGLKNMYMGSVGLSHKITIGENSHLQTNATFSGSLNDMQADNKK